MSLAIFECTLRRILLRRSLESFLRNRNRRRRCESGSGAAIIQAAVMSLVLRGRRAIFYASPGQQSP